ncbi:MAG TPA: class I SAM-dependent methyltransferase [Xanthobacteraceae bacterium]
MPSLEEFYESIEAKANNLAVGGGNAFAVGNAHTHVLSEIMNFTNVKKIMDFGCGIGRTMPILYEHLGKSDLVLDGCDISNEFIGQCRALYTNYPFRFFKILSENSRYARYVTSTEDEGIPESFYDAAYSFSVFTHLTVKLARETLVRVAKCLKSGGQYYFTMFRIDQDSAAVINSGGENSQFKFSAKVAPSDTEYFALASDPLAFAAIARPQMETAIDDAGFFLVRFVPGAWRGIPQAPNMQDGCLVRKN